MVGGAGQVKFDRHMDKMRFIVGYFLADISGELRAVHRGAFRHTY